MRNVDVWCVRSVGIGAAGNDIGTAAAVVAVWLVASKHGPLTQLVLLTYCEWRPVTVALGLGCTAVAAAGGGVAAAAAVGWMLRMTLTRMKVRLLVHVVEFVEGGIATEIA